MERSEARSELLKRVHGVIGEYRKNGSLRNHRSADYYLYFADDDKTLNEINDKIMKIVGEYSEFEFDINKCTPYMSTKKYEYITFTTKPCIKSVFVKAGEPIRYKSDYILEYENDKLKEFKNTVGIDIVFTEKVEKGKKYLVSNYDLKLYYNSGTHKYFCGMHDGENDRFRSWAILAGRPVVQHTNNRKKRSDDIESKCDFYLTININDEDLRPTRYYALVVGGMVGAMDTAEEIDLIL